MLPALLMVAVVAVLAVYGVVTMLKSSQRGEDVAVAATRAGLEYSGGDPFECTRLNFPLFREGDGRGAEHVMWKDRDDNRSVRAFDYWYYDEHQDQNGQVHKTYRYCSCALGQLNGSFPELAIERERALDRVVSKLGFPDIQFESEEFNRMFLVRGPDARFATALIDPQMMEFLLTTRGQLDFFLRGRWLLVVSSQVAPHLLPGLWNVANTFLDKVPEVVWDLYPSNFLDADGHHLPAADDRLALDRLLAEEEDDPWDTIVKGPFGVSGPKDEDDDEPKVDYDLDGNVVIPSKEDPWRDLPPSAKGTDA